VDKISAWHFAMEQANRGKTTPVMRDMEATAAS